MILHDEGIETVIRWLEQCDSLYEREYAQNAIKSLREFQILRSLEPCPYCGSVETREKLQQQNEELREHSKRLAGIIEYDDGLKEQPKWRFIKEALDQHKELIRDN